MFTNDVYGEDISTIILNTLCNEYDELTPIIGDSLQSGSPMDVSFWPIHPSIERMTHWKLIDKPFVTTVWGPHGEDMNYTCYGHSKTDTLGWTNIWDEDNYLYTNEEIVDFFDPTVEDIEDYQMSYIFDNFLWEQCTSFGIPATLFD